MKEVLLLKLGGSIVTDKSTSEYHLQTALLKRVFGYLSNWYKNANSNLVIVHGCGGCTHNIAHEYDLRSGTQGDPDKLRGSVLAHDMSRKINEDICLIAGESGLPVTSVDTSQFVTNQQGKLHTFNEVKIIANLEDCKVPIMHGDMVPDIDWEYSISSGDHSIAKLAEILPVKRVLFASDIDGLFTADPHKNSSAELIETISMDNVHSDAIQLDGSHNIDTTGGLRGKLESCKHLFAASDRLETIEVFNGANIENYKKILAEIDFPHTTITQ